MVRNTNDNGMTGQIDLVIPMVFADDGEWLADYHRFHNDDAVGNVRFRSWHTEQLLIDCVMRYMPWLRKVHILLARESQHKPWMDCYDKVHVVYHRDFMPADQLPCFASPCIEMFLGNIPDLAEQFIYANDDMFPLSPLQPDDFFHDGKPCLYIERRQFPSYPNIFQRKCINQQNMIAASFGKQHSRFWLRFGHSFAPILKSVCEEVWKRHGKEIIRNLSPLRRTDHSYNQYIYLLYEHYAGLGCKHSPYTQYAGDDIPTSQLSAIISSPIAGVVCINDNENIQDWQQRAAVVRKAIISKLGLAYTMPIMPIKSTMPTMPTKPIVAIVHYNTPKLTQCCIRSLLKHTAVSRVIVFDNSDKLPFMMKNKEFVRANAPTIQVIDNTHGDIINFPKWLEQFPDREPSPGNSYGSAKHCYSVQWLIDHIGQPFILMDSDVLIRRDVAPFWQHPDCAWVGEIGENVRERFGYDIEKLQPFFCYINAPMLKQHNIAYFNPEYMWNLTSVKPNHRYDTGAWFLRATQEAKLPVCELPLDDYILHLGHASWRDRKPMAWLDEHKELWD